MWVWVLMWFDKENDYIVDSEDLNDITDAEMVKMCEINPDYDEDDFEIFEIMGEGSKYSGERFRVEDAACLQKLQKKCKTVIDTDTYTYSVEKFDLSEFYNNK